MYVLMFFSSETAWIKMNCAFWILVQKYNLTTFRKDCAAQPVKTLTAIPDQNDPDANEIPNQKLLS